MKTVNFDPVKCSNSSAVLAMLVEKHPKDVVQMHNVNWATCEVSYDAISKAKPEADKAA